MVQRFLDCRLFEFHSRSFTPNSCVSVILQVRIKLLSWVGQSVVQGLPTSWTDPTVGAVSPSNFMALFGEQIERAVC